MSQLVLLDGEVLEATVYKDLMCKHAVTDPYHGQIGYMIRPTVDCEFVYDADDGIWKPQRSAGEEPLQTKSPIPLFRQCLA
jgi:hypothetical protein